MKGNVLLLLVINMALCSGCSVVGLRTTPQPAYEVLEKEQGFELRLYKEMWIAKTTVEKADYRDGVNRGFRKLFNYISGKGNAENKSVPMTAPVFTSPQKGGWTVAFVMPPNWSRNEIPPPSSPEVSVEKFTNEMVAVKRYSGKNSEPLIKQNMKELEAWMSKKGYLAKSSAYSAGYDPPWTLPHLEEMKFKFRSR